MSPSSAPRIERLRALPFQLPLSSALEWGQGSRLDALEHVLVEVTLSSGAVGYAEAPPRPTIYGETSRSIVDAVERFFAPALCGASVDARPAVLLANNQTAHGAVDLAVHHALAVHRGVSLAELVGASATRVRVSTILGLGSPDGLVAEAQRAYDGGIRVLKVKVGADWEQSLRVARGLREHFGDDVALYADANETMTPDDAPARLGALRELGFLYCEEPLPVEQAQARRELRARTPLPIIADDSAFSLRDLRRELELDSFDVLNLKPARTGYTESLAMLRLAQSAGKSSMVGSQAGSGLGAARAAVLAACGTDCPSELGFFLKLDRDVYTRPLEIRDGWLALDQLADLELDRSLFPGC